MHLFAIVGTEPDAVESEVRALTGSDPPDLPVSQVASDGIVLGVGGARNAYPVSLASEGPVHAACVGDFLQMPSEISNFAESTPAAALWDAEARRLTAGGDRVGGFFPLYCAQRGDRLALGSRLHSLLTLPWVDCTLELGALHELLATGCVLPPDTLLRGVRKLGPGEVLSARRGSVTRRVLDRVSPTPAPKGRRLPVEAFEELLSRSLAVFDVLGREVALLVDAAKTPGGHTVPWDAGAMPAGTYLCRLQEHTLDGAGRGSVLNRKLVLIR
jgi:hypothetical protein